MRFIEYGKNHESTIILLHGGGLACWSYFKVADLLSLNYHVVIISLDGHDGSDVEFTTIEDNACEIIEYIDKHHKGRVKMISGLSLGAQIVCEILSRRKDVTDFAVIESVLVKPMPSLVSAIKMMVHLSYPLIKNKTFAKIQFKALKMNDEYFLDYYNSSLKITKNSLINLLIANSTYQIKEDLKDSEAKVLIMFGEKENKLISESALRLSKTFKYNELLILDNLYHGQFSINQADKYVAKILEFMKNN